MSKEVKFKHVEVSPGNQPRIRLELIERNYWGAVSERRQFTVYRGDLVRALKEAGLYEEVRSINSDAEEEARLANEIAAYHALSTLSAGPGSSLSDRGKAVKDELWRRITTKLNL